MINLVIGKALSGRTIYIKKKIIQDLKRGNSIIYINFFKSSDKYSRNFKIIEDVMIVNANSFSQISKIKDKEFNQIVLIDRTRTIDTEVSMKTKNKIIKEIVKNENRENHNIYIEDGYLVQFDEELFSILEERNTENYIALQNNIETLEGLNFENKVFFEEREKNRYIKNDEEKEMNLGDFTEFARFDREVLLEEMEEKLFNL